MTLYTRYSNIIRLNQKSRLTVKSFRDLATAHRTILQFSGAQSYIYIGAIENITTHYVKYSECYDRSILNWNQKSFFAILLKG